MALLLLLFLATIRLSLSATVISVHQAVDCFDSSSVKLLGPDNGVCTSLNYDSGGIKVENLDSGCSVTFYGNDVRFCSSQVRIAAVLNQCYDATSFGGYTIDNCNEPNSVFSSESLAGTASATPTQTPRSGGSGSGLTRSEIISIGVGLPLSIITIAVTLTFGIRHWNRKSG